MVTTPTNIGDIDLTEVDSLHDAHAFAIVDDELLVSDGRRTDPVDLERPITIHAGIVSLPVKGGLAVVIDPGHALLYAITFGLEIETHEHTYLVERVRGW